MGMFDRVIVECKLPDAGAVAVKEWQNGHGVLLGRPARSRRNTQHSARRFQVR